MKSLVIDIQADDRPLAQGGTVASVDPQARRCRVWLYTESEPAPSFRGEAYVSAAELEMFLAGREIFQELGQLMQLSVSFSGEVPDVPPEPKAARLAKLLRNGLLLFR